MLMFMHKDVCDWEGSRIDAIQIGILMYLCDGKVFPCKDCSYDTDLAEQILAY